MTGPLHLPRSARRRPLAAVVAALALSLGATSCATFTENRDAVRVGDQEITQQELGTMLESPFLEQWTQTAGPVDGVARGEFTKLLLSNWVYASALVQAGLVPDDERAAAEQQLTAQFARDFEAAPEVVRRFAIDSIAVGGLLNRGVIARDEAIEIIRSSDVALDPRYGWWDEELIVISGFGPPG